ncbi:hypothetical protein QVD17_37470 [Tagetes erecta]|uniref:Uncharacterized protein n=1 Tax=Tagetes erecta TaxID=13708 RepID=A0AAD8NK18_TARER|nr:hypothetical protein QVD17_37470 [Tagetes erecta]
MDQIVKELEEVLEYQWKQANLEHGTKAEEDEGTSLSGLKIDFLKIPLIKIKQATNDFHKECHIGSGGFADVYKAKLDAALRGGNNKRTDRSQINRRRS